MKAAIGILAHVALDDALEFAGDFRRQFRRRIGLVAQHRGERGCGGIAAERPAARDHFIEHRAETEDVGARVQLLAFSLLRRHVSRGAGDLAFFRNRCSSVDRPSRFIFGNRICFGELDQAEIQDLGDAIVCDHDVRRLQVAV
jgi:hypothetical protein